MPSGFHRISLFLSIFCLSPAFAEEQPPNIVLIISDDQAYTDYGFMGHPDIATPNLDKLAASSALFGRGYVPTALCRPSLMTLATGLYAHQHKVSGNDPSPQVTPPDSPDYKRLRTELIAQIDRFPTLPKLLAEEKGYLSHQSGKWWEGNYIRGGFTHGMTRGFPNPGGRHGDDGLKIGRTSMKPIFNFIEKATEEQKPFFVWYAPFLPHTPHNPPERLLKKYQSPERPKALAKYYAMCEWFDETCGQLLDYLDQNKLSENTLVIYVCDNGWIQNTPEVEAPAGWNKPFAPGSKLSPNEAGTRTPIMFRLPGVIPPGKRDDPVSSIDIVPTALAAAGIEGPEGLPGLNLLPDLKSGKPVDREAIFGESFAHDIYDIQDPTKSLLFRWCIVGEWKLLLTYDGMAGRYASVYPRVDRSPQLFNLLKDPSEKENLASENPDVVADLTKRLEGWYKIPKRDR